MSDERTFPIQRGERGVKPHPTRIPWHVADLAYSVYSARFGTSQSLERLAERGGFGPEEMDMFLPDWRERCDENARLKARVAELEAEVKILTDKVELLEMWRRTHGATTAC